MDIRQEKISVVNHSHVAIASTWLQSVKDITCDKLGCIYWRGFHVSMLMNPYDNVHKPYLIHLRGNCEKLFEKRIPVNMGTAEVFSHWFQGMKADEPYKKILVRCPTIRVTEHKIFLIFERAACEYDGKQWQYYILPVRDTDEWKIFAEKVIHKDSGYEYLPSNSSLDTVIRCLKEHNVPVNLLELMSNLCKQ